jgi:hypothetical protein
MSRALVVGALCLFVLTGGCARRRPAGVQTPRAAPASAHQPGRADRATKRAVEASQSLTGTVGKGAGSDPSADASAGTSMIVLPGGTAPPQTGTGGSWSVENRYPRPPGPRASTGPAAPPPPRGRLLSRARAAAREAGGEGWLWIAALSAVAAVLAVMVAVRRTRRST